MRLEYKRCIILSPKFFDILKIQPKKFNNSSKSSVETSFITSNFCNGYVFDERFFNSFQEVQCYKYLKYIGISPKKMHMEYRIGKNHFDFFPLRRIFWEHHPINLKLGKDIYKYGKKRRQILDNYGYEKIPLVVSDIMFEDINDISQKMSEHDINFRKGTVPTDTGIYFLRDYQNNYLNICYELLTQAIQF